LTTILRHIFVSDAGPIWSARISSLIPNGASKVGHLLRFDFDEIVEWTKDKEK
jgi:hypothetical protein